MVSAPFSLAVLCLAASAAIAQTQPASVVLRFDNDSRATSPFSAPGIWLQRTGEPRSLVAADADPSLILAFGAGRDDEYTAINDLGTEDLPFTVGGILLAPSLRPLGDRFTTAGVDGGPLRLAAPVPGESTTLTLGARDPKLRHATLELRCPILLADNLRIGGDGNQIFNVASRMTEERAGITVTKTGRSAVTLSGENAWTGPTRVEDGVLIFANGLALGSGPLSIASTGVVAFADTSEVPAVVSSLEIAERGTLDLARGAVIVDYPSDAASPAADIVTAVRDRRILSNKLEDNETIAVAEAGGLGTQEYAGRKLDGSALIVRVARFGDANLDGVVNREDLVRLKKSYNGTGDWTSGDFNRDGKIDFDDLLKVSQNYDQGLDFEVDWNGLGT